MELRVPSWRRAGSWFGQKNDVTTSGKEIEDVRVAAESFWIQQLALEAVGAREMETNQTNAAKGACA